MSFSGLVKKHWVYVLVIIFVAIIGIIGLLNPVELPNPLGSMSDANIMLLGLAMVSLFLLWGVGIYLFYRWVVTGQRIISTLCWSLAFLVYGILFLAMCLKAFGIPWADMSYPIIFFEFRQVMIWFLALLWLGVAIRLTDNALVRFVPALLILVVSYAWFAWCLIFAVHIVTNLIEYIMYGFTFGVLIPVAFTLAYTFFLYGRTGGINAPYYLAVGFAGLGITYGSWAPWHPNSFYYICFFLFMSSVILIAIGFLMLSRDVELQRLRAKLEIK
jgi:hypothetical protein